MNSKPKFISSQKAYEILGISGAENPSLELSKMKKDSKVLAFVFPPSPHIQIPDFQFNDKGIHPIVPQLCKILDGLNDIGVYRWLNSYCEDLRCKPYQAIDHPFLHNDLIYLAGLFKSHSTLRYLSHFKE